MAPRKKPASAAAITESDSIASAIGKSLPHPHVPKVRVPAFVPPLHVLLVVFAVGFFLWFNLANITSPILEEHAFRQTQTAITAWYIMLGGPWLAYYTPVVGEPWSIPFEFPIYQLIVAALAWPFKADGLNTFTAIGRGVSVAFTLAACIPMYATLRRLGATARAASLAVVLFLSTPMYAFWGGTFMIESTAVFFTCAFIYYATRVAQRDWTLKTFVLLSIFLLLGLLQKVTTILVPLGVAGLCIGLFTLKLKDYRHSIPVLLKMAASVLIPLAIAYAWIHYSDTVKMANEMGAQMTSKALAAWNYGTLEQRTSSQLWNDIIYRRNVSQCTFLILGTLLVAASFRWLKGPERRIIVLGTVLFLVPFLIFTNLHIVHTYYQSANMLFYTSAVAVALAGFTAKLQPRRPFLAGLIVILFVGSNYVALMKSDYYPHKLLPLTAQNNRTLVLASYVTDHTSPQFPVIWFGFDWSSEGPFYTQRKGIAVPDWGDFVTQTVLNPQRFLSQPPSAIVNCPSKNGMLVEQLIQTRYPGIAPNQVADCHVYIVEGAH